MAKRIRSVEDLAPDKRNANRGTERGTGLLEKSVRQFGLGRSILVDREGRVIAGNKTLEAAAAAGLTEVQVIQTDGRRLVAVQRMDLDLAKDPKARALALADNRVGELNLDWDLGTLMDQVPPLADLGLEEFFTEGEMKRMLAEAPEEFPEKDGSIETTHECPRCHYRWTGAAAWSRRPARAEE
jgi:hypothetical protein